MHNIRALSLFLLACLTVVTWLTAEAQKVIATVTVGEYPTSVALNGTTNKIYAVNACGNSPTCSNGTVSVFDGATLCIATVAVGINSEQAPLPAVAVNETTNKIYVTNPCGNDSLCLGRTPSTVTVIDGVTLATTTVTVGIGPSALAVNSLTNKIYVANSGTVTVIDGATLSTTSVPVELSGGYGWSPAVAVNQPTNKIFVTNPCGTDQYCNHNGSVTIIDGSNLSTTRVEVGKAPWALAVNPLTNKIYVANASTGSVTVIDGDTLMTTTVPVGFGPESVAIDQMRNKIYVANSAANTVSIIDGETLSTTTVSVGASPGDLGVNALTNTIYIPAEIDNTVTVINGGSLSTQTLTVGGEPSTTAVDEQTNRIYVVNRCGSLPWCSMYFGTDGTVSVIEGAPPPALQFVPVTPCRLVDTRPPNGGGPIRSGTAQSFALPQEGACGSNIPASAAAYSLNVTVVPHWKLGYLTVWPTGVPQPTASLMNSLDGRVKANAAIVAAGSNQAVSVFVTDTSDVVLDINGYFTTLPNPNALAFYPLTPCRVADTRDPHKPAGLGPPSLSAGVQRDLPILNAATCNIPNTAQAYSMNFTVVPQTTLGYLTVWPTGENQPVISTLNDQTGTVLANAAIVPAGTGGDIDAYATNNTDLIIDINGYFAPPGLGGLSLYSTVVCRVLDTRSQNGGAGPFSGTLVGNVEGSTCTVSNQAQSYVFNATVVPQGSLGYLTLWPDGGQQPVVSTLNAADGALTSNMAIVPAGTAGKIDAYAANGITNLLLDISSYFAP